MGRTANGEDGRDASAAATPLVLSGPQAAIEVSLLGGCCCTRGKTTPMCLFVCALLCCGVLTVSGALLMFAEPELIIKEIMKHLPRNPSWAVTIGWGCAETLAITTVLPVWIPMAMTSPILFGISQGLVLNLVAITLACHLAMCIAQTWLRDSIREIIDQGHYPTVRQAMLVMEDTEQCLLLLTLFRFLCLPLFVKNYGLGSLQVPMWKLCLSSLPHCLWMSVLFTSWGHPIAISLRKDMKHDQLVFVDFVPCLIASAASMVVALLAGRKYNGLVCHGDSVVPASP